MARIFYFFLYFLEKSMHQSEMNRHEESMRREKRKDHDKKGNGRAITPTRIKKKQEIEKDLNEKIEKELLELEILSKKKKN